MEMKTSKLINLSSKFTLTDHRRRGIPPLNKACMNKVSGHLKTWHAYFFSPHGPFAILPISLHSWSGWEFQ